MGFPNPPFPSGLLKSLVLFRYPALTMFKLANLASFIVIAGMPALSAPSSPRSGQCHPNFGGRAISIVTKSGGAEWGYGTLVVQRALTYQTIRNGNGEFRAEFTGNPDSSYYIKASNVPANDMFVSQGPRSNILAWAQGAGPSWSITCESCPYEDAWNFPGGKFATGCTISRSGLCVRESTEGLGSFIRQYSCEGGDNEKFDFLIQL